MTEKSCEMRQALMTPCTPIAAVFDQWSLMKRHWTSTRQRNRWTWTYIQLLMLMILVGPWMGDLWVSQKFVFVFFSCWVYWRIAFSFNCTKTCFEKKKIQKYKCGLKLIAIKSLKKTHPYCSCLFGVNDCCKLNYWWLQC